MMYEKMSKLNNDEQIIQISGDFPVESILALLDENGFQAKNLVVFFLDLLDIDSSSWLITSLLSLLMM